MFSRVAREGFSIMLAGCFFLCVGFLQNTDAAEKGAKPTKPLERAFPHSEKCKRCHLRVFEEWEASAQSRSITTATFRKALERFLRVAEKKDQTMCFSCHAPSILEYPHQALRFVKEIKSRDPHVDGVGCAQCHLIHEVDDTRHPPVPSFQLGKTVFGGYKKAAENLAHQSQANPLFRKSQFCVTCHDSLPPTSISKRMPGWLGSWKNSKAEKEGKACQDCHMPKAFGESANGERNRKIANHSFPGRFGKVRAKAVELDIQTHVKGDHSQVQVAIQSLVPHNLPLPHPGWSRVIVDLTILGKNLSKVYGEQRYYERVFGNQGKEKTIFDFEAASILKDTLLQPEEKRVETFTFPTPKDAPSMDVIVTISYAPVHGPAQFLGEVEEDATLGNKDRAFQLVQVTQERINIPLKK